MQSDTRFVVTKCNESLLNNNNMNEINLQNSTTNDKRRSHISFKESRYNRGYNQEQGHLNPVFNLDESDSEYSTINLGSSQHSDNVSQIPEKTWDSFTTNAPQEYDDSLSTEWINIFIVFFKLLIYLLTFLANLCFAVISVSTLLLMTSMIRTNQKLTLCRKHFENLIPGKTYVANYSITSVESIGWIWALFVVMIAPQIHSLIRCLRYCMFKNFEKPKLKTFLMVFLTESLSTIGMVLLVIMVLPNIEPGQGAKLSHSISLIPGIFLLISRICDETKHKKKTLISMDMISIVLQLICCICWAITFYISGETDSTLLKRSQVWIIPILLIFVSFGFWDNYLTIRKRKRLNKFLVFLFDIKENLNNSRYFTYVLISIWKIVLILITILMYFLVIDLTQNKDIVRSLFKNFDDAFSKHKLNITPAYSPLPEDFNEDTNPEFNPYIYLWVVFIQIMSTILCYMSSKFVSKIQIQVFSFSFPLTIVAPITIVMINVLVRIRQIPKYDCKLTEFLRLDYIFWYSDIEINDEMDVTNYVEPLIWFLSLCSQIWITSHIWEPKSERLAKTENLFTKPEFNCLFIDQSLILNRKVLDIKTKISGDIRRYSRELLEEKEKEMVRIYLCATMWHENTNEMSQMLKSVFRMDIDQSARRQAKQYLNVTSDDYYECETHILFDDAFENNKTDRMVNSFVKDFIEQINLAASAVHDCQIRLKLPTITWTPYGGQLIWTLPGQNKLFVHLKDKNLIRHKKRWSQVMYMYYLLGYRLKDQEEKIRDKIAENTFILALDGDINFRPKAVRLLVDLMKKHKNLGAACGRIHPIGGGPMVWYQKFEYAIGHWLQKATEHVIGCVLCSPGCFSLFRAKALMSENVMNKYTSKASEAIQYVQYDQGEDRWLCTLLLQRGWRIEYCAASDSYTHSPEGFGEFYNQRRRWAPSTLFNIWDLLQEFRRTVQINDNISTLYIIYQFALMIGTVFSPGCIFLMIVGAMNTSFNLSSELCLLYSGAPILLFIVICFYCRDDIQIRVALILSIIYALLMLAVIVSTIIEMVEEGLWQPTALFFISLCLSFLVAALIHPTEFLCFLPILLYLLCIPSMYLLLTIYSIINLNVVSWGTREGHSPHTQTQQINKINENKSDFLKYFNVKKLFKSDSKFISCICCSDSVPEENKTVLKEINEEIKTNLQEFKTILKVSERDLFPNETLNPLYRMNSKGFSECEDSDREVTAQPLRMNSIMESHESVSLAYDHENERPLWTTDKCFESFVQKELDSEEKEFWRQFIDKYLLPLDRDPKHEEKVNFDLRELRDKIASAFGLLNSLFILLVLLLQIHQDIFKFKIPFKGMLIQFDFIGICLIIFFGLILLIQFLGMLWHRFNTFSLLLAVTELNLFGDQKKVETSQQLISENAVHLVKQLQKIKSNELTNKKKTLIRSRPELQPINSLPFRTEVTDLDEVFLKRVKSMKNNFDDNQLLPESKIMSFRGRKPTIKSRDVRREIYRTVSKRTKFQNDKRISKQL